MGGGGGGSGGPVWTGGWFFTTGAMSLGGGSTNARKTSRPVPSYFVSSLAFSRSKRNVGSRDRPPTVLAPPPWPFTACCGTTASVGEPAAATGTAALDEPPPNHPSDHAPTPTATASSTPATINVVRFSAPSFTTASSSRFPP